MARAAWRRSSSAWTEGVTGGCSLPRTMLEAPGGGAPEGARVEAGEVSDQEGHRRRVPSRTSEPDTQNCGRASVTERNPKGTTDVIAPSLKQPRSRWR